MFIGEYTATAEEYCRICIPKSFRDELIKVSSVPFIIIVTRDAKAEGMRVYPVEEWKRLLAKVKEMKSQGFDERVLYAFKRVVMSCDVKLELDKKGRVYIPSLLSNFINVSEGERVVFIGQGRTILVQSETQYNNTHYPEAL